jgi:hypothetical protein
MKLQPKPQQDFFCKETWQDDFMMYMEMEVTYNNLEQEEQT